MITTVRVAFLLIVTALVSSPAFAKVPKGMPEPSEIADGVLAWQQKLSLRHIYYRNTPKPVAFSRYAKLTDKQKEELEKRLEALTDSERELLDYVFGPITNKEEVLKRKYWATQDTDGDGIKDYMVSGHYGKFSEYDLDADNDGVLNVYDPDPYVACNTMAPNKFGIPTKNFPDKNGNGIPDHIDFQTLDKADQKTKNKKKRGSRAAAIQKKLFDRYKIILVERGFEKYDGELAGLFEDAIEVVFGQYFRENNNFMPSLRTLSLEISAYIEAEELKADNESELGLSTAQTNTFSIYRITLTMGRLEEFGFIVHELAHNWEYQFDFIPQRFAKKSPEFIQNYNNTNNTYNADRFHETMALMDWTRGDVMPEPKLSPLGIPENEPGVRENNGGGAPTAWFMGFSDWDGAGWDGWLNGFYNDPEFGDTYLSHPEIEQYYVVNDYSVSNVWEWFPENLRAYSFLIIEQGAELVCKDRLGENDGGAKAKVIREQFRAEKLTKPHWFNYPVIQKNKKLMAYLNDNFKVENWKKTRLAKYYLTNKLKKQGCLD